MLLDNEKIELIENCRAESGENPEHADIRFSKFCCEISECDF